MTHHRPMLFALGNLLCLPAVLVSLAAVSDVAATETLTFDQPQMAGISGFRALGDLPIVPGEEDPLVQTERGHPGKGLNAVWTPDQRDAGAQPGRHALECR